MSGKNILGLAISTDSIGFCHIHINSEKLPVIRKLGVRVVPLENTEKNNYNRGIPSSINTQRTLKRSQRRNLQRYKARRKDLIQILREVGILNNNDEVWESGKGSTHDTWALRSKSVVERVELSELARVLLALNKKRGYKAGRLQYHDGAGFNDDMETAQRIYKEKITPGQLIYQLLQSGQSKIPVFYSSDLRAEFRSVWEFQKEFYPLFLTEILFSVVLNKGAKATASLFKNVHGISITEMKGNAAVNKVKAYELRSAAVSKQLEAGELVFVLAQINNDIQNAEKYLTKISDRSKQLYFGQLTVGQFLYGKLKRNAHSSIRNEVFSRQDYINEFEAIWNQQAIFYTVLNNSLKKKIRDNIIFYQRNLKSQKKSVNLCLFENHIIDLKKGDNVIRKKVGLKVAPKSSPLSQEFNVWCNLQKIVFIHKKTGETYKPDSESLQRLFDELNIKGKLSGGLALTVLGYSPLLWKSNFKTIYGNHTANVLWQACLTIIESEGYNLSELFDLDTVGDEKILLENLLVPATDIKRIVVNCLRQIGINSKILDFQFDLQAKAFEKQAQYELWHMLYSVEESVTVFDRNDTLLYGHYNIGLKKLLCSRFGFKPEHTKILAGLKFASGYAKLSSKAMKKILPYLKESTFTSACISAGYQNLKSYHPDPRGNNDGSRKLSDVPKNSFRSPVWEKILNQLIHVVNGLSSSLLHDCELKFSGQYDEIYVTLADNLKENSRQRALKYLAMMEEKGQERKILKILIEEFAIEVPQTYHVEKYKLYAELAGNNFRDIFSNTYIGKEDLFSDQVEIVYILPHLNIYDDSFTNKVLMWQNDRIEKGDSTAFDFVNNKFDTERITAYRSLLLKMVEKGKKTDAGRISKEKYEKLLLGQADCYKGLSQVNNFIDNSYFFSRIKELFADVTDSVYSLSDQVVENTTKIWNLNTILYPPDFAEGIDDQLESSWGLFKSESDNNLRKRNKDYRENAAKAIVTPFIAQKMIQFNKNHSEDSGNPSDVLYSFLEVPIPNFRQICSEQFLNVLVSHKSSGGVTTTNYSKLQNTSGKVVYMYLTARGQLHKETLYGKYGYYCSGYEKIGAKFDASKINKVTNPTYRALLLERLDRYGGNPKKAFSGSNTLLKRPIYLDEEKTKVLPERVKIAWLEQDYSVRKDINAENIRDTKVIEKVVDQGIKRLLKERLEIFDNNPQKAFGNLEDHPLWLNKKQGISIKRIKLRGVENAQPLHYKRDYYGNTIFTDQGLRIPSSFVSTGNNHHVAFYLDENGVLQDTVVSFFDAVRRMIEHLPVVDRNYNSHLGWKFLFSMKQNEYFIFDLPSSGLINIDLLDPVNKKSISPLLFRVQKLSRLTYGGNVTRDYVFRHHADPTVSDNKELRDITFKVFKRIEELENIVKVRLNHLGDIVEIGE